MAAFTHIVNKFQTVRQIPIFSKLNWFELHTVATRTSFAEYKKGEIVCLEGSPPDALYCVVSGRVQAFHTKPNGDKEDVELILRGMHFGIISLLTGEHHSLTFQALNDSVILKINKDDFAVILKAVPKLGIEFSRSLSRRVRNQVIRSKTVFESTIISVYSPVKGSGSSTFAINLALSLQRETKRKVIFIGVNAPSLDVNPGTSGGSNSAPSWKKTPIMLKDILGNAEKIKASITKDEIAIDLINIQINPQDAEVVRKISQFITSLTNDYHYVVVDLPNDRDEVVFETLLQSDHVYLLSQDENEDLLLVKHVIERLKESLKLNFDKDKVQFVLSCIQPKCFLSYRDVQQALDYPVSHALPYMQAAELNTPVVCSAMSILTPGLTSEYARATSYLARRIGGVLVGVVLGGGAALGVAHVGVIRVLEKENIPVDMIVGSSIGALIGALWATGRNAEQLEVVAREFESKKSLSKLIDPVFPKAAFVGGKAIERWLRKHLGHATFMGAAIPLKVVAYDLLHREEIVISEGSLVDAVRKSIAIPGVIAPIQQKEKLIIDGGVLNPLPTNVLVNAGIKKIIAINVLQSPADVAKGYEISREKMTREEQIPFSKAPGQFVGIRLQRFARKIFWPNISDIIVRTLQASEFVIAQQSATQADVLIHPDLSGINWFELYQVNRLIRSGEEAAYKLLPDIKKLVFD